VTLQKLNLPTRVEDIIQFGKARNQAMSARRVEAGEMTVMYSINPRVDKSVRRACACCIAMDIGIGKYTALPSTWCLASMVTSLNQCAMCGPCVYLILDIAHVFCAVDRCLWAPLGQDKKVRLGSAFGFRFVFCVLVGFRWGRGACGHWACIHLASTHIAHVGRGRHAYCVF
jgi:hypothetical protein